MHDPMLDIGFCLLYMYVPVVMLYQSPGGSGWTYVNQSSGIDHHHLSASMYMGSACHGWLVWVGLNYSRVINGHMFTTAILKMSESQYVVYSWMCLNLKFNSHLYRSGDVSLFCQLRSCWVSIGVGTLALIRSHTSVTTDGVNTQHAQICYDWPYLPEY